jgi:vacuolar protein sorting-associated protein 13A/C
MKKNKAKSGFLNMLSTLGLALTTVEDAPITLNALTIENVFGTTEDIKYILQEQYTARIKKNLFRILGSSALFGNPIMLANSFGTGVKEFFQKPIEGFVEGPLEGANGILKGTGSLFKNTVSGTFGSASSIFGSISKGLLVVTGDRQYIERWEEEKIRDAPKNIIDGAGKGLIDFGRAIGSGVVGVVKQPYKETKKSGIGGFFKGVGKGFAGLIVKPVSGTFDLISKTSEGVKATAKGKD